MDLTKSVKTYEVTIKEIVTYILQGSGRNAFEAEQDAIERFHRLDKEGTLEVDSVGKPKAIRVELVK